MKQIKGIARLPKSEKYSGVVTQMAPVGPFPWTDHSENSLSVEGRNLLTTFLPEPSILLRTSKLQH